MVRRSLMAGAAAFFLPVAAPASAHVGYLAPVLDDSDGTGWVILEATFSDVFLEVDIALTSDEWAVIAPDGSNQSFDRVVSTPSRSVLDVTLEQTGTYRFSTGERLGRKGEIARVDGAFHRIGSGGVPRDTLPADAEILSSQTATVSDLFLARGEPETDFHFAPIGPLVIQPLSNPAELETGDSLVMEFSFAGAPLAGQSVTVFSDTAAPGGRDVTANDQGRFRLELGDDDSYLILTRHIAEAPDSAETEIRSYSTALTLIVSDR